MKFVVADVAAILFWFEAVKRMHDLLCAPGLLVGKGIAEPLEEIL